MRYYTVYKVTNLITGKFYIGAHATKKLDDFYMGSGDSIRYAIKKYGRKNFKKEILEVYDTKEKMYLAEKVLIVIDKEISYNIKSGGSGGVDGIKLNLSVESRFKRSECRKGNENHFYGKTHSEDTKIKISESKKKRKSFI